MKTKKLVAENLLDSEKLGKLQKISVLKKFGPAYTLLFSKMKYNPSDVEKKKTERIKSMSIIPRIIDCF